MKTMLFPHSFQKAGWIIFALSATLGGAIMLQDYLGVLPEAVASLLGEYGYAVNNTAIIGIIVGGILATCSKESVEDEMISSIRLTSLLTALYIHYALIVVASLLVYDLDFLNVMLYGMFTIIIIFMIVFRWRIWQIEKEQKDEEQD